MFVTALLFKMWIFNCLLFCIIIQSICPWRIFYRGRGVGGNIGKPPVKNYGFQTIPEEWFDQSLDHFNPTDTRTWKQVIKMLSLILYLSIV